MKNKIIIICLLGLFLGLLIFPLNVFAKGNPVIWNPKKMDETIGLGGTKNLTAIFTSSTQLQNVDLWVVPELKPFVSVEPKHFDIIKANTSYTIKVHISIPYGTQTKHYDGTVHLKVGSKTYPQTLKMNIHAVDLMTGAIPPPDTIPETTTIHYMTEDGTLVDIEAIQGQVVILFDSSVSESTAETLIISNGGDIIAKIPSIRYYLVSVTSGNEMNFINNIKQNNLVVNVMPNLPMTENSIPNEWDNSPLSRSDSWYLDTIKATSAWDLVNPLKLNAVEIGIIDQFKDLDKGTNDFTGRLQNGIPTTYLSETNHGTNVVALCCAEGNNKFGNVGVNWWSKIRLYSSQNNAATILFNLTKSIEEGAKVINLSLGVTGNNDGVCDIREQTERFITIRGLFATIRSIKTIFPNFIVTKAAGNDNCEIPTSILKPDNLMIVGATNIDIDNVKSSYSDYGVSIDIAAPGGEKKSKSIGLIDYNTNLVSPFNGTSAATPLVTGAAALVWAIEPSFTPQEVIKRLKDTAQPFAALADEYKGKFGTGILDVCKALDGGTECDTTPPIDPTSLSTVAVSSSQINLEWNASPENDVAEYRIYRDGTYYQSVITTSFSDTGLIASTQYCYAVSAYDAAGNESAKSSSACAITQAVGSDPSIPTGVTAIAGDGQVSISWSSVSGATSYNIYWSTTSGVTKTTGTQITTVTIPYTHTGRTNGTTYYYVVTAVNSYGESTESNQVSATPAAATGSTMQLPKTGQTTTYATGDDGDLENGVAWPNPRFTVSGDCITDNLTGLMWVKSPDSTTRTWADALTYANNLSLCGYTDWRLPDINELESLVNAEQSNTASWLNTQGFSNEQANSYWSSTTSATSAYGTGYAWDVTMHSGFVYYSVKTLNGYVVPVRAGQGEYVSTVNLPETGQTTCYDSSGNVISCTNTGQDGDIKAGVTWPSPRFTAGTGAEADCITDNLTGLMWVKSPDSTTRTWQEALDYANNLSLCGYTDWRLPNRKELMSLINYGQSNTASWLNTQGFSYVQADWYWSSTTAAYHTGSVWYVNMSNGSVLYYVKTVHSYVLPVRAGQ